MVRYRDVLFRNRSFTYLWFAQVISNFGDRVSQMALIALVYRTAPGSSLALAKVLSFTIIPVFVVGPVAGAWVDRWNKRDVMIISDLLRGFLALALILFIVINKMPLVYLAIFLIFSVSRFFIPSKMAIIPELVEKDELLIANSLTDTTRMIGNVIGLVVAGLIVNIRFIGPTGGFVIYSLSFFTSACLSAMIVDRREFLAHIKDDILAATHALEESIRKSIFTEMKEGILFLFAHKKMRFVVKAFSFLMAALGSVYCVIITFVQESFGNATRDLSFLMIYLLAGLFAGTVLYGRFGQRLKKERMILLSFVTTGSAIISFAFLVKAYPSVLVGGSLSFLIGLAGSPIMVSSNTIVHEMMPEDVRGKVFSSLEAVINLAFMAFMFLTGIMDKYIEKVWILAGCGAACVLFGIAEMVLEAKRRTTS